MTPENPLEVSPDPPSPAHAQTTSVFTSPTPTQIITPPSPAPDFLQHDLTLPVTRTCNHSDSSDNITYLINPPHKTLSNPNTATVKHPSTYSSSSNTTLYPSRLTDEEQRLLHNHKGCLKCHKFYISHCANQCTITLSGKDYKVCTLADAL